MDAEPQRHLHMMQQLYDTPAHDTAQEGGQGDGAILPQVQVGGGSSPRMPPRSLVSSAPAPVSGTFAVAAKYSKKREWGATGPLLIPLAPPPAPPSSSPLLPASRLDRLLMLEPQSRAVHHPQSSSSSAAHAEADRSVLRQSLMEGGVTEAYEQAMVGGGGGGGAGRGKKRGSGVLEVPSLLDQGGLAPMPMAKGKRGSAAEGGRSRKASGVGGQLAAGAGRQVGGGGGGDAYQPFEWLPDAIVEHHQQQMEANSGSASPLMGRRGSSLGMAAPGRKRSSVSDIAARIVAM